MPGGTRISPKRARTQMRPLTPHASSAFSLPLPDLKSTSE